MKTVLHVQIEVNMILDPIVGLRNSATPSLASPRLGFFSYPTHGTVVPACANTKKPLTPCVKGCAFAVWTGLEPATPCVTGRYSNQLNYQTVISTN